MISRRDFLAGASVLLVPGIACAVVRPPSVIPRAYLDIGARHGVPPIILFSVALAESKRLYERKPFRTVLPWPWTLNVAQTPLRFEDRDSCRDVLYDRLRNGTHLVDIGLMQVCWRWHRHRFQSAESALDPMVNLNAGAQILRECYESVGEWHTAVGLYHAPNDPVRARDYAAGVYRFVWDITNA